MERLLEPDDYIRHKVPEFVANGDFGYASGAQEDGYYKVWYTVRSFAKTKLASTRMFIFCYLR